MTEAAFFEAIQSDRTKLPSELFDWKSIPLSSSYDGPHIPDEGVDMDFVKAMVAHFKDQKSIAKRYAVRILTEIVEQFRRSALSFQTHHQRVVTFCPGRQPWSTSTLTKAKPSRSVVTFMGNFMIS